MALVPTVTKKEVTKSMDKMWNIVLTLSVMDGAVEVVNEDFALRYRTGQTVSDRVRAILGDMQEAIDDYKAEKTIMDHAQLNAAVTYLTNNLTG